MLAFSGLAYSSDDQTKPFIRDVSYEYEKTQEDAMPKRLHLALITLLCFSFPLFAVTINGTATLQGETIHSGIRVLFTEASPSAVTDSAFTDGSGNYSLDLAIGVYDIQFSYTGFVTINKEDVGLTVNQTLDPRLLLAEASALIGDLSGTLTAGDYWIVGNVAISQGLSLTIQPGTNLYFTGPYSLTIQGSLTAVGTETDSIRFTHAYTEDGNNWDGLRFAGGSQNSQLEYCVFEYSKSGALQSEGGSLEIHHSSFRHNTASEPMFDSCVSISSGLSMVADCDFVDNTSSNALVNVRGGTGTVSISDCRFLNNESTGRGIVQARAFNSENALMAVEDCIFSGNTSDEMIRVFLSNAQISGCEITNNTCSYAGAIYCLQAAASITNCTIADNTSHGVVIDETPAIVNNCVIANNGGFGFTFDEATDASVTFCNIWQNASGPVGDPGQGPVLLGQIVTVNQNDDSSDVYYNISQDPMFINRLEHNFHLQGLSHCIDAGDTTLTDPDGTICDIGAYYYPQSEQIEPGLPIPESHTLLSSYPNPFNPSTNISFVVDQAGLVNLTVFDITGRIVAVLVNETKPAGAYTTYWNATSSRGATLPSGSYWVRLNTPSQQAIHRIVLIR